MIDIDSSVNAEFIASGSLDVDEVIILTGGMNALALPEGFVKFYPVLDSGGVLCSKLIPQKDFREWISCRKIDFIGVKQVTYKNNTSHWHWAPAVKYDDPPNNNPSYKWQILSSSILTATKRGERYQALGEERAVPLTNDEMIELATQARYIGLALHQLNFAIINIAEHFQNELISRLSSDQPSPAVYSHIRSFDLSAFVHGFFQAYSSARDHYAIFISILIRSRKNNRGKNIDSMPLLFGAACPSVLRNVFLIAEMERKGLVSILSKEGVDRFGICRDTWFWYSNDLRNRFTHRYPYGSGKGEEKTEVYFSEYDPSIRLVKAFLENDDGKPPPNLLRTTNYLYQRICGLFLLAAESTGYISDPPKILLD